MKKNILYVLVIAFCSCSVEYVKDDLGVSRLVIKDGEVSSDSLIQLNYFFGNEKFLVEKINSYSGHSFREITTYQKGGLPLSYRIYDNSDLKYFRLYDKNGGVRTVDGSIIIAIDSIEVNDVIVNEKYIRPVRFINPPNTKIEYIVGDDVGVHLDNRNLDNHPMQFYEVNDTISHYVFQYNKIGIYRKELHWRCEDVINSKVQKGKIIHQYNVIKEACE